MIIGVSCGEPATNLNCAVARSPFCIMLRLCCLVWQGDGALCRPDMRYASAFLDKVKIEANERYPSMRAREDCSLLASIEDIARSQQERIDRFI